MGFALKVVNNNDSIRQEYYCKALVFDLLDIMLFEPHIKKETAYKAYFSNVKPDKALLNNVILTISKDYALRQLIKSCGRKESIHNLVLLKKLCLAHCPESSVLIESLIRVITD